MTGWLNLPVKKYHVTQMLIKTRPSFLVTQCLLCEHVDLLNKTVFLFQECNKAYASQSWTNLFLNAVWYIHWYLFIYLLLLKGSKLTNYCKYPVYLLISPYVDSKCGIRMFWTHMSPFVTRQLKSWCFKTIRNFFSRGRQFFFVFLFVFAMKRYWKWVCNLTVNLTSIFCCNVYFKIQCVFFFKRRWPSRQMSIYSILRNLRKIDFLI